MGYTEREPLQRLREIEKGNNKRVGSKVWPPDTAAFWADGAYFTMVHIFCVSGLPEVRRSW